MAYPLAPAHYIELEGANPRQRREIGHVMYEFSRGHRMIGPNDRLLAAEIDAALRRHVGVPVEPRTVQIFGRGVAHAFGVGPIRLRVESTDGTVPSDEVMAVLAGMEPDALEFLERMVLEGHRDVHSARPIPFAPTFHDEQPTSHRKGR